ncbi:hypothetical protein FQN54_009075 [Arachnomyces sp. PD_36]|nr:hypothetical protein FQN54_009075 [Arachnomyces sp. PD_36]
MEGVHTVDVSWLHHSQKGKLFRAAVRTVDLDIRHYHLVRSKSNSSTHGTNGDSIKASSAPETVPKELQKKEKEPNDVPPSPTRSRSVTAPASTDRNSKPQSPLPQQPPPAKKPTGSDKASDPREPTPSKPIPINTSRNASTTSVNTKGSMSRRNSWISSISSKFSSGSTPPSRSHAKDAQNAPDQSSPSPKVDLPNPFGAAYSPGKDEKKDDSSNPFTSSPPAKSQSSFFQNALRKLSSSGGSGGLGKLATSGVVCQRRVMNVDQNRDRCRVPELNQAKLRRVAFCVDVEIAGVSRREGSEEGRKTSVNGKRSTKEKSSSSEKSESSLKGKGEGSALKNPQAAADDKEKNDSPERTGEAAEPSAPAAGDKEASTPTKEAPTKKQEKKKKSEEERKERKGKKRRQAEANGSVPMQLTIDDNGTASGTSTPGTSTSKTQDQPTTDPVRIYRRCCQLRETGVLKKLVEQISSPSSILAESPGTVAVLDLTGFSMTLSDCTTFSDWLAVVPVRKLILEECSLSDEAVRVILAGLLSTKTVEQARLHRKHSRKPSKDTIIKDERYGVIERLSLKNNSRIGNEGWRHIGLFVHLSKSLKAIDLSGIPFPKTPLTPNGPAMMRSPKPAPDVSSVFADALAQRFGGNHLEELLLSECNPSTEDVGKICDAAISFGLRRLGLANNGLTKEGLEHVVRYIQAGHCEGLDLGGNDLQEHLELLAAAVDGKQPLYALSLADCSLLPSSICSLLQAFTKLPNFRFIDLSHNHGLFSTQPDALSMLRRYLPKMPELKRIHLADVNLTSEHAIALAEILAECPRLCHLNILENSELAKLAAAKDAADQEEACALYASLMTAVRVSRTLIAVDIEVPTSDNNEVVKALASQIVAYSLRNLERGALQEELPDNLADLASSEKPLVPVPDILLHIVGHLEGAENVPETDEPATDEDYVIGGTGVVKALGVCLGNADRHNHDNMGEMSPPPSGASTPLRRVSATATTGNRRPKNMSKNLLESARKIRTRLQSALIREDQAGNDVNYRRLQFLDATLDGMIQRFEDEYPETRMPGDSISTAPPVIDTSSQHSSHDETADDHTPENGVPDTENTEEAVDMDNVLDDEEAGQYSIRLSRASSNTSLHSRALTSEEGRVHRFGQHVRRGILGPEFGATDDASTPPTFEDTNTTAADDRLERLRGDEIRSRIALVGVDKALEELDSSVEELWVLKKQDPEAFERLRESQIAAQINAGLSVQSSPTAEKGEDEAAGEKGKEKSSEETTR